MSTNIIGVDFDPYVRNDLAKFSNDTTLYEPLTHLSEREREHVCDVIESYGYWATEVPAMLGLVES
jgi:hypothetical protein